MLASWLRRVRAVLSSSFGVFLGASASTNVADGIRAVALPLLAVEVTRDPTLVAGLGVAQSLPFLIVGLPAGVVADRWDRRRVLIASNVIEVALFASVAIAVAVGVATMPVLYAIAFCLGSNESVRDTTMSTALPALVGAGRLNHANGRLVSVAFVGNQLAGPALGAALFAAALVAPFVLSAVLTAGAVALVLGLPSLNAVGGRADRSNRHGNHAVVRFFADIAEGAGFLIRHRLLRMIAALAVILTLTDAAWFSILVLLITDELGQPGWVYGAVLAVAAVGGAAGGWLADRIITRIGTALVLRGTLVAIGAAQVALGLTHQVMVATVALAVGNAGFGVWLTSATSQREALTPDHLLGRVTAAWRTASLGAIPIGMLAGGVVADAWGLRAPFLLGAPLVIGSGLLALPITSSAVNQAWQARSSKP